MLCSSVASLCHCSTQQVSWLQRASRLSRAVLVHAAVLACAGGPAGVHHRVWGQCWNDHRTKQGLQRRKSLWFCSFIVFSSSHVARPEQFQPRIDSFSLNVGKTVSGLRFCLTNWYLMCSNCSSFISDKFSTNCETEFLWPATTSHTTVKRSAEECPKRVPVTYSEQAVRGVIQIVWFSLVLCCF